jgi:hypothetical protein
MDEKTDKVMQIAEKIDALIEKAQLLIDKAFDLDEVANTSMKRDFMYLADAFNENAVEAVKERRRRIKAEEARKQELDEHIANYHSGLNP